MLWTVAGLRWSFPCVCVWDRNRHFSKHIRFFLGIEFLCSIVKIILPFEESSTPKAIRNVDSPLISPLLKTLELPEGAASTLFSYQCYPSVSKCCLISRTCPPFPPTLERFVSRKSFIASFLFVLSECLIMFNRTKIMLLRVNIRRYEFLWIIKLY